MKVIDVHQLRDAKALDAAFAKTFGLGSIEWAESFDQDAVTDYLEGLRGTRRVWGWELHLRNWNRDNGFAYEAVVSSENPHIGIDAGVKGHAYDDFACHALMKAAIEWDQRRRESKRKQRGARWNQRIANHD